MALYGDQFVRRKHRSTVWQSPPDLIALLDNRVLHSTFDAL
jgi:hypothetical protein